MGFFKRFIKPKATVSLIIDRNTLELGEEVEGKITIASRDEFEATGVRAELRCVEKRRRERWIYDRRTKHRTRQEYWDVATLHSDDLKGSGKFHLIPGFKKSFSFKGIIPAGGRESFDGLDENVKWSIKGVLAIDDRPDVTSKVTELQIIRAILSKKGKKEKMVPCEYCDTLISEKLSFCPNCGAPRKS